MARFMLALCCLAAAALTLHAFPFSAFPGARNLKRALCKAGDKCQEAQLARKPTYVRLAELLLELTPSETLEDNTREATRWVLGDRHATKMGAVSEIQDPELKQLATTFARLKGTTRSGLCELATIENVGHLVEAMRREGNLSEKRMTPALNRLNQILVRLMKRAQTLCFGAVTSQRVNRWS